MTCTRCDQLATEAATQRRAFAAHDPAATTLRAVAPFVRAALDAHIWPDTATDTIRRQLDHTLAWLDQDAAS